LIIFTIFRLVVPRTIESSTSTTRLPNRLLRLDDGAPDVVVPDQAHLERDVGLLAVPDRRAHPRIRHGHDDVGVGRRFLGEAHAQVGPHLVHAVPEHVAVGPREVDVFEDAVLQRLRAERLDRPQAAGVDDQDLARFHVPHVGRADQIERARLRADDEGIAQSAECERTEAVWIAHRDQPVVGQDGQRIGAAGLANRFDQRALDRVGLGPRVQVQEDLRVAGGLEDRSLADEVVAQLARVDEVAVVADGNLAVHAIADQRLGVDEPALAGGRVADVPDRVGAGQLGERRFVERVGHLPHDLQDVDRVARGGRDAGALLSAVLERVQAEVHEVGGLTMSEDTEDSALVLEFIEHDSPAGRGARPSWTCRLSG
jgi:hypothetical protein